MMSFKLKILLVAVLLIVIFALFGGSYIKDIAGIGGDNKGIYIEVSSGESLNNITETLVEKGIVKHKNLFKIYAKSSAKDFQFGGHVFSTDMSYSEICKQLCEIGTSKTVTVVIPEGYELRLIANAVDEAGLVETEEFIKCADNDEFDFDFLPKKVQGTKHRLEGYLFPATYEFAYGSSAHTIISTMLKAFENVYKEEYSARAKELGMTDFEIITLASVIEREAANMQEHKRVSGVFYNRIRDNMSLQSCATVQYVLEERKDVLSIADTKIESLYNTYKYSGLPVGPIASPGKSAIEAALYPEDNDYYYFVVNPNGGGHIFSKTYKEHVGAYNN